MLDALNLVGCRLCNVDLSSARLPAADLQKNDLSGPDLSQANLRGAAREVGEQLLGRMFQSAYDHLPWKVREIAANYLFPEVDRAGTADDKFQAEHLENAAMVRRMPLFATLDEGELDRGDYLGELALLNDAPRNATCRATVPTELLSLSRQDFENLVKDRFALRDKLDETITRTTLLRRIPLFTELDSQQLQLIVNKLREETFESGQVIIQEGDIGETFYIIESGHVQVSVHQNDGEIVIDENSPGSYVGEIALLMDSPRTASVIATIPTRTLTLYKDDFDWLVADHLYVSRSLEQVMSRRMIRTRQTLPEAA